MLALGLLALAPLIMWAGQSVLLRMHGLPLRWRLTSAGLSHRVRQANRIITNAALATVLVAYPLCRGESPIAYYARFLPLDERARELARGIVASTIYLALLYAAWILTDNVRIRVRHSSRTLVRRLLATPLAAILGATIEEMFFRAMLLASLLDSLPAEIAMALGVLIFAAAHYVRQVKRYWTFAGHVALGVLLCTAFYCTQTLWLPIGLHAGGILLLSGLRPFARYRGPAWLVGASIFPYAGVAGVIGLGLMTLDVWLRYGGVR